jgi:ribonuclease BN (tRNA processing enzyme)
VDGKLAVDAGSVATQLPLDEQGQVKDVLLTHSHLDHVRDLPLLLINCDRMTEPLRLHGTAETIDAVRRHLFNQEIWFEAFSIPSPEQPMIAANEIEVGSTVEICGYEVTGFALSHTVPSTGWLIRPKGGGPAVYFAGDTDDENCLAAPAAAAPDLAAAFVESSFPNGMEEFAKLTGHLTPAGIGAASAALPENASLFVTHLKPGFEDRISADVDALGDSRVRALHTGETLSL